VRGVVRGELLELRLDTGLELAVGLGKLDELQEIARPGLQVLPDRELMADAFRGTKDRLGGALVRPEVRRARCVLERIQAGDLGGKVKAAPWSRGSGPPDRG
jgi:hypothetical protein